MAEDTVVVGVGNELRGDDGAGLYVARRLREAAVLPDAPVIELRADPVDLLETWAGARTAILIDAVLAPRAPGTVRRFDARARPLPTRAWRAGSTHTMAVAEAIELGRALDRLPGRLTVFAVGGRDFGLGHTLSGPVAHALPRIVEQVRAELLTLAGAAPTPARPL